MPTRGTHTGLDESAAHAAAAAPAPSGRDGAAPGYAPRRTLPLRVEVSIW